MSANKLNYYVVETTTTVKALNMSDAQLVAKGNRKIGSIVKTDTNVKRVRAATVNA